MMRWESKDMTSRKEPSWSEMRGANKEDAMIVYADAPRRKLLETAKRWTKY